jgi:hypothetical protein
MEMDDLQIEDVAGASLTIIGVLIESYIKDGYCDPMMFRALKSAEALAHRFKEIAIETGDPNGLLLELDELLVNLQVTAMEAGQVVEDIINENNLPVDPRTFEPLDSDDENG